MKSWLTFGLGLALIGHIAGCGGEGTAGSAAGATAGGEAVAAEPPPPPDPLRMVPADAFAVVELDVDALRASAYYERLLAWLVAQTRVDARRERLAREVLERTHRVVLAALPPKPGRRDPDVVVAARGDYEEGELARLMSEVGAAAGDPATVEGRPVYVEGEVWATEAPGPCWVFGTEGWIRELLGRPTPGVSGSSPLDQPDLDAMAARVGFGEATITGVMRILPELRDRLGDDRWLSRETGQSLRVAGLRGEVDRDVDLDLFVRTADPSSAQALANRSGALVQWAGSNLFVRLLGLGALFEGTQVRADADHAVLTLHVEDAEVDRLLTKFEAMAGQLLRQQGVDLDVRMRATPAPASP